MSRSEYYIRLISDWRLLEGTEHAMYFAFPSDLALSASKDP